MESEQSEKKLNEECVGHCKGHAVTAPNWTQVTVVAGCDIAAVDVYQVAVAGAGGTATGKSHLHGIVAVASTSGNAISGDGGVAVSANGKSRVEKFGYAYAKMGGAVGDDCSVAATTGGMATAGTHGIGIGWYVGVDKPARVEAGVGGVAIGNTGCFVKAGVGGVLIAMDNSDLGRQTKICRVGEDGICASEWYEIQVNTDGKFQFSGPTSMPVWKQPESPCPKP